MKFEVSKGKWIIAATKQEYATMKHKVEINNYTRLIFTLEKI